MYPGTGLSTWHPCLLASSRQPYGEGDYYGGINVGL